MILAGMKNGAQFERTCRPPYKRAGFFVIQIAIIFATKI